MLIRWLRFNVVGIAGVGVQLTTLWLLTRFLGMPYIAATVLSVETALLHNFVWHEVWTWRDMPAEGRIRRLARFHVANGLISIASNALFTWLFRQSLGMPLLVANFSAIAVTALLNFALASLWVFRPSAAPVSECMPPEPLRSATSGT